MAGRTRSSTVVATGAGEIVAELRREILSGRMPAGVRVTEAELVKRFGVGRGLVREAVQRLTQMGLLLTRPNCGAVVAPEAPKAIRRLIVPIRRTIEAHALELVFEDLAEEDFRRWNEIVAQMRPACLKADYVALAELDIAFHRHLIDRAGQPDLISIWETLVGRIRSHFRRAQRRCPDPMEIYEEHANLLKTFREGTLQEAVRLLKEKID
jgi:DNA-binding GntR family transcriptional regulator